MPQPEGLPTPACPGDSCTEDLASAVFGFRVLGAGPNDENREQGFGCI